MSIRWYQNTIKLWHNFPLLTGFISFLLFYTDSPFQSLSHNQYEKQIKAISNKGAIHYSRPSMTAIYWPFLTPSLL